jgi:hypothetical protein
VTVNPIAQPAPSRARKVFIHRQRVDVTDPAAIEDCLKSSGEWRGSVASNRMA